jgi:hypothetical protein
MFQFKSADGSEASRRWAKSGVHDKTCHTRELEGVSRLPLVGGRPHRRRDPKKQYLTGPAFPWKPLTIPLLIAHPETHLNWSEFGLNFLITGASWMVADLRSF